MSRIPDVNAKIAYLTRKTGIFSKPELRAKQPLCLKNRVRGSRATVDIKQDCGIEANAFFQCLQDNDFLDSNCMKEFKKLADCDKKVQDFKIEQKQKYQDGESIKGNLHSSAINQLLQKYPNPTNKEAIITQRNLLNTLPMNRVKPFPYRNKWNPRPKYGNGLTVPDE